MGWKGLIDTTSLFFLKTPKKTNQKCKKENQAKNLEDLGKELLRESYYETTESS